jgi:uncharacterized protein
MHMGILSVEMKRVVSEQRLGYIATVNDNSMPNLSPRGTLAVWDDDTLIFADIRSPGTTRNLRHNPAVAINVVDPILRKGYRFTGVAYVHDDGDVLLRATAFYQRRGVANPIRAVVLVRVTEARPLISPAYDLGASEAEIRARWERYMASVAEGRLDTATGE